MESARTLLSTGALSDADRLWRAACDMTGTFAPHDPRRAASLDALGTLAAAKDNRDDAAKIYDQALDCLASRRRLGRRHGDGAGGAQLDASPAP